jgi:polyphosphate kinase 2 (PPK2 family)
MHNNQPDDGAFLDPNQLSLDLIAAQYQLKAQASAAQGKSLLILLSGIELAGKGESVKQLREWVDPRYLRVKAGVPQVLSPAQPFWQPYVSFIPKQGQITLLFGNWYGDVLATALQLSHPLSQAQFEHYVASFRAFEQDLAANQVQVLKIWIDLSWPALQKRLDRLDPSERQWQQLHGLDWRNKAQYDNLQRIRQQFSADWLVIDGQHAKARNQRFAQAVLQALTTPLAQIMPQPLNGRWKKSQVPAQLIEIPEQHSEAAAYKAQLKTLTRKVARALRQEQRKVLIVLEGVDAAGKGGAIKRIVKDLDPREYTIYSIAAPEPFELSRPYLWRFWRRLSDQSGILIFDRSWYGRVLVERIEGLAKPQQWKRAYAEINRFEQNLLEHDTVIIKIWLAIDPDEQEKRFLARENTPHKRFKITAEDWRNRQQWAAYLQAAADMLEQNSPPAAPWYVVACNDKYTARLQVLRSILTQLKKAQ